MIFCDDTSSVIQWSSEEVVIPYISPIDGRTHRYFVDFWVKVQSTAGEVREYLIEVKPKAQTKRPEAPKTNRVTKSQILQMKNWLVNSAKWSAARAVCETKGWEFKLLTEDNLFTKTGSMT